MEIYPPKSNEYLYIDLDDLFQPEELVDVLITDHDREEDSFMLSGGEANSLLREAFKYAQVATLERLHRTHRLPCAEDFLAHMQRCVSSIQNSAKKHVRFCEVRKIEVWDLEGKKQSISLTYYDILSAHAESSERVSEFYSFLKSVVYNKEPR